jgi:hypothetical protein
MRTAILVVAGFFAVFFAASGIAEAYDCFRWQPWYAPTLLLVRPMWMFVARQLATSAVFVGLAWLTWRQPRRPAGGR